MFNLLFTDPNNALLQDRLQRAQEFLRSLTFATREEYQAAVYSSVNAILNLGSQMTPLTPVSAEGPAIIGDLSSNAISLNRDAGDIANEILRIEDAAGTLFNLAAATQNNLRQAIRQKIFANSGRRYREDFLNSNALVGSSTATVDYQAGVATLPLTNTLLLTPVISIGKNSLGTLGTTPAALSDNDVTTSLVWNGTQLELILTLPAAQMVNRLVIGLDDYEGLEITAFSTTPDGTLSENVLNDLGLDAIPMDCTSGKYSGTVAITFPPKHMLQMRLVISDLVGKAVIALRSLAISQCQYGSSGLLQSNPIAAPLGLVQFQATQRVNPPFTSITHQLSYDGVAFVAITPGMELQLASSPFWYRAVLERSSAAFDQNSPLTNVGYDPAQSSNYSIRRVTTLPLGNGIIERSLTLDNVTGPITLADTPLPGSLQVQEGSVILPAGSYAFNNGIVSFPSDVTAIVITYQTSALGLAALKSLENYYTPVLEEFRFDKV
jgi:hypothetical protein